MSLLLRINLGLVLVFAIAAAGLSMACSELLKQNGKAKALAEASLMMESALAIRAYTSREIGPLLMEQMHTTFLPQSVPSYAATQNFLRVRESHQDYSYKEATLNPTNPRDRATDWEADIVRKFRDDPQATELSGERDTPLGRSLFLARPIRAAGPCLQCHSVAGAAPESLIARYGSDNGFGWQPDEVVAAQIVSVPLAKATAVTRRLFRDVMTWVGASFLFTLLAINAVLYFVVVRPVHHMASVLDRVSQGDMSAPPLEPGGGSEITALTRAFNRLRISLEKAMNMIDSN